MYEKENRQDTQHFSNLIAGVSSGRCGFMCQLDMVLDLHKTQLKLQHSFYLDLTMTKPILLLVNYKKYSLHDITIV